MTTTRESLAAPAPGQPGWIATEWPRFLDAPLERTRTPFVVFGVIAIAASFDLAMRSGLAGVAGALSIGLASVSLLISGRVRNVQARVLIAAAPLFGTWIAIRASVWLLPLDVIAACALVLLGATLSSGGSLFDLSIVRVVGRTLQALTQAVLGPSYMMSGAGRERRRFAGIARGLLLAIPILLVFGLLLASADAVFASIVRFDARDVIGHLVLLAFGALASAALFRMASLTHAEVPVISGPRLASMEWTVVLVALNALLGAFAVARLIALSAGGRKVIESAGLTYAEYARSGFFQLLAAAVLVTGVIAALRATAQRLTRREKVRFTAMTLSVIVLTLALVVSAFHRLVLYESAFGLTMLRLFAQTAIVWVGLVLLMLGASVAGLGGRRVWVWSAAGITALVLLFGMNVLNPEAFVARHNIAHQARTDRSDTSYLSESGDDAVPALAEHDDMHGYVCAVSEDEPFEGWAAYNLAHARANDIRTALCVGAKD